MNPYEVPVKRRKIDPKAVTRIAIGEGKSVPLTREQVGKVFSQGAEEAIAKYRRRLERRELLDPIKLNNRGWLIDGAHRVLAAREAGVKIWAHYYDYD